MIRFSIIVPTRGRPALLGRLLSSLRETARNPDSLEVITIVDADDPESLEVSCEGVRIERVLVPPGLTMGELNLAGYRVARGRYLMLLNDDVVACTLDWDIHLQQVMESFPDGIVLAHVNDLLFRDTLCTFPVLTREFCEIAGGVCRPEYRRYRIDDHIHHLFDLIYLLGHRRRVFLPDVVFEHRLGVVNDSGALQYVPDPSIHRLDSGDFERLIEDRRRVALECAERIEKGAGAPEREDRMRVLRQFPDSIAIRRREHARLWRPPGAGAWRHISAGRLSRKTRAVYWVLESSARLAARWPVNGLVGGIPPALFDAEWYRSRYPEVAASGHAEVTASGAHSLVHYLERGGFEGHDPNPHFHSAWYLAVNPDVAASGLNPLLHFVRYGAREHRSPNLWFDVRYYEGENPDAAARGMNPLEHFICCGLEQERAPCASLTVSEYLDRLTPQPARCIAVRSPAALSVVIPTRNRATQLLHMLDACRRHAAGCELEFIVVDDGSEDGTPQRLRDAALGMPNLRWLSVPKAGPGRARNLGVAEARHDVVLFLGDDIHPANHDFFRTHAARHAEEPSLDFAVLGNVVWPDDPEFPLSFTMAHIRADGAQFAFSRLTPGSFAGWQYFYSANLSVKKARVRDWMVEGFDSRFQGAALEDIELGYRLSQSRPGVRLLYDPASIGLHLHPYTLGTFLERQDRVGRSLRYLIEVHPELVGAFAAAPVYAALRQPRDAGSDRSRSTMAVELEELRALGLLLEARGELGSEDWHGDFLSALFELCMHDGCASAWPPDQVNLGAARAAILERFWSRMGRSHQAVARLARRLRPLPIQSDVGQRDHGCG
jgi:glycosyltransferase involved in cell wall biosynthesis